MNNNTTSLNHKAYMDVLDCQEPTLPHNPIYMQQYSFWMNVAGPRHSDPTFTVNDD